MNLLHDLKDINSFANILLNLYSNKIEREEAKNKKINSIINKNEKYEILFKKYQKAWNNVKEYATRYECRPEMKILEISNKSPLSNFLLDNGELYHGMYLASIYDMFIEWQNNILDKIKNNNAFSGLLNPYINLLSRKIYIQKAQENEIMSLSSKDYKKIDDNILLKNTYRNCFEKNKDNEILKINYLNYDSYNYDFDEMEIELGKLLLIGKKFL